MFNNPFSFDGRIRRTEYGLSVIFYALAVVIINLIIASNREASIIFIAYIPMLWFLWAQGAKRCHDVGNSGWWQLIPLYGFWLLFQDGIAGSNQYGENPKGIQNMNQQNNQPNNAPGGYQGGYSGGHNNPNSNYGSSVQPKNNDGYNNGDLYK